jgi:hypothetical protein
VWLSRSWILPVTRRSAFRSARLAPRTGGEVVGVGVGGGEDAVGGAAPREDSLVVVPQPVYKLARIYPQFVVYAAVAIPRSLKSARMPARRLS